MSIRERLLAFAAGSPIGDDRSPRPTEPYGEYELDRRRIKWSECIFRFAVVSVALLVLGCALSGIAYAAQKGQWSVRDSLDVSGPQATGSKRYVVIRWSDIEKDKFIDFKHGNITAHEIRYEVKIGNGSADLYGPIYVDKNGKTVSSKTAKTKKLNGSLSDSEFLKSLAPSWAPDGWEIAKAAATGQESTGTGGGPHTDKDSAAKDPEDMENQLIKDNPPDLPWILNSLSIPRKIWHGPSAADLPRMRPASPNGVFRWCPPRRTRRSLPISPMGLLPSSTPWHRRCPKTPSSLTPLRFLA